MRVSSTLDSLVDAYKGDVRVVYKNLVVHPDTAMAGHLGACAAGLQGKFKPFMAAFWKDAFGRYMENRDEAAMSTDAVIAIATQLGVNVAQFKADLVGTTCMGQITRDQAELDKFEVSATPTFIINGSIVSGAMSEAQFRVLIDAALAKAKASGVPAGEYYQREIMGKGEKVFRSVIDPKP